jgi:uncharacterized phage protein gp47/JayE
MTQFGLTPDGYRRKRLQDVKEQIEEAIIAEFGQVNLQPDSVFGQLVGVFSVVAAELYEDLEQTYHSQYPSTAEGVSLDRAVDLVGVRRLEATRTRVLAAVTGDQGVNIPAGTQIQVAETGEIFTNPLPGVITRSNALAVRLNVQTTTDFTQYTVIINNTPFVYTSGAASTPQSIAQGLIAVINAGSLPVTATYNVGGQFDVTTTQNDLPFNLVQSANMVVIRRTSPLLFESQIVGPVLVLPNTLTEIVTPVAGWQSVTNWDASVQGRNTETDQQLRIRRLQSFRVAGAASVEAIQARLRQNVQDVITALVFENREPFPDSAGRPPHSFEAVVVGGQDSEIAQEIWEAKAAGIQTFGNTCVLINDSTGMPQQICFSRPVEIFIWGRITISILSGSFPVNGISAIEQAFVSYGQNNFTVGDDIIYQEFYGPIYQIGGLLNITVELATSMSEMDPPGPYTSANVPITEVQVGMFDLSRVSVVLA